MAVLNGTQIVAALNGAKDISQQALLQLSADLIRAAGPPYTSVYLYMLHGDMLVLKAFSGRETVHTHIPVGKGICGTAVATGEDQNIGDVRSAGNYLACNLETRSELVVLIRRGSRILGQIDVDSDVDGPFAPQEQAEVRMVADALAHLL
jgi:L-methionine (R)-S-oxide reductase